MGTSSAMSFPGLTRNQPATNAASTTAAATHMLVVNPSVNVAFAPASILCTASVLKPATCFAIAPDPLASDSSVSRCAPVR